MLETAAIIAYKQPVTRMDLEELRGNSEYAIQNLLKLGIIEVVGRKDAVGKPVLFGTTDKFLKRFRISSLEQLPNYDELMEQVKLLNSNDTNYLYHKDTYVDDGTEDVMPPQRQFVPQTEEEVAITEEEPAIKDLSEEEVPAFLKDEDVELIENEENEDFDEDEDFDDEDVEEDDGEFDDYSIDDEEYEDEEEDDSDYEDDEDVDDSYEEDDL
jgi:segregation and condensation protein B